MVRVYSIPFCTSAKWNALNLDADAFTDCLTLNLFMTVIGYNNPKIDELILTHGCIAKFFICYHFLYNYVQNDTIQYNLIFIQGGTSFPNVLKIMRALDKLLKTPNSHMMCLQGYFPSSVKISVIESLPIEYGHHCRCPISYSLM